MAWTAWPPGPSSWCWPDTWSSPSGRPATPASSHRPPWPATASGPSPRWTWPSWRRWVWARPVLRGLPGSRGDGVNGAFAGERAVVVGFGVSGRAAAEVLAAEGATVRVTEARSLDEVAGSPEGAAALREAREAGVEVV